jgi:hypothetical protein
VIVTRFPLQAPALDPAPIFEACRGNYATELLCCAVAHLRLFPLLAESPLPEVELGARLKLAERPLIVLLTALRALGLITRDEQGRVALTQQARVHLLPESPHYVGAYVGLAAESAGVRAMLERLQTNQPAGTKPEEEGAAFIYREGLESAMEKEAAARRLTLALAGRAHNVAPVLATVYPLPGVRVLLDVGGGTGLYSLAYLERHPDLRAVVWDRPEVLKVASELAEEAGLADRLTCMPGDMFRDPPPCSADAVLLSNVLHDWDVPECRALLRRCTDVLAPKGQLLIHEVFLTDALDGPLPLALYSAAIFSLTEGRLYSASEYRTWLSEAGLAPVAVVPTLAHCGILASRRA